MAEKIGDAFVEIGVNANKFKTDLAVSQKSFSAFGARTTASAGFATHAVAKLRTAIGLLRFAMVGLVAVLGLKTFVKAFIEQERAVRKVEAALADTGGNVGAMSARLQNFAAAIQDVTTFGDELVLQQIAFAKNLGVSEDQLEGATKAAIGLSAAFEIDLKTAMNLIGRASKGQTQLLTRYGIVLSKTGTDQEKFNELLRLGADKFRLAEEDAKSLAGVQIQLSNRTGDLKEAFGAVVTDLIDLEERMMDLAAAAKIAGDALMDAADEGVFIALGEAVLATGKKISIALAAPFIIIGELMGQIIAQFDDLANLDIKGIFGDVLSEINDDLIEIDKTMEDRIKERMEDLFVNGRKKLKKFNEEAAKSNKIFSSFADILKQAQLASLKGPAAGAPGAKVGFAPQLGPGGTQRTDPQTLGILKKIERNTAEFSVLG